MKYVVYAEIWLDSKQKGSMPAASMILEASAANKNDLTMQVPVARLRTLRDQVQHRLGLPDAVGVSAAWFIFCDTITAVLTVAECHAALRGEAEVEAQIIRLKSLLFLTLKGHTEWHGMEDDEVFRLRCFRSSWDADALARRMEPDDDGVSFVEKAQVAWDHLQSLQEVATQLPECTWCHSARLEISMLQRKELR